MFFFVRYFIFFVGKPGQVIITLLFCLFFITSCASRDHIFQQLSPLPPEGICRVAVLPPVNRTEYLEGDILVYRVLQNNLTQRPGLLVSQEGDVRRQYHDARLQYGSVPTYEELRVIADRLGVQALILAEITGMHEINKGNLSFPALTGTVKLIDGRTGTTIWLSHQSSEGEQYRKVMHFGLVNTMTKLAGIVSDEIFDSWVKNGFGKCEN